MRETDSLATRARIWDEVDPAQSLARDGQNPSRAFRLHASHPGAADLGARQGPLGAIGSGSDRASARVANWGEIMRLQNELMRASFERMNRLNGRYLEVVQDVMRATVSAAGQARRAA